MAKKLKTLHLFMKKNKIFFDIFYNLCVYEVYRLKKIYFLKQNSKNRCFQIFDLIMVQCAYNLGVKNEISIERRDYDAR